MSEEYDLLLGDWPCRFARFTPSELANVTGLSTDLQRVWRRRGYLPAASASTASFSVPSVIEIAVRYALSCNGIPPSESAEVAKEATPTVLWSALLNHDGACEITGSPSDVEACLRRFETDDSIAKALSGGDRYEQYLFSCDGSPLTFAHSANAALDMGGAVATLVVDLNAIGSRLMTKGRKPLVTITTGPVDLQNTIRRLTGSVV